MTRYLLFLFIILIAGGCGRVPQPEQPVQPRSEIAEQDKAPVVAQAAAPDLAARLSVLTPPQQQLLKGLLAVASRDNRDVGDDSVAEVARALRSLTLAEAEKLGQRLDAEFGGNAAEFALEPIRRQQRALEAVRQIQNRLTKVSPEMRADDAWIGDPVTIAKRDLPWLARKLGGEVSEVIGLSFAREFYDLGPDRTDVSNDEMKLVADLTGLERLDLRLSDVSDDGLAHLANLRNLESLDLSGCRVTDNGLRHLAGMSHLAELKLSYADVSGDGLEHLRGCHELVALTIVPLKNSSALNHLKSLEELNTSTEQEVVLHDLPNLDTVTVGFFGSSGGKRKLELINLPNLETARIEFGNRPARIELKGLPKILRLTLSVEPRSVPFDQLGNLTNIQELNIYGGGEDQRYSDDGIRHLAGLRNLTQLWLGGSIDPASIQHFENLTELRVLTFGSPELDDAALTYLRKLQFLQELTILAIHGSGRGFDVVQQMPKLRSLTICRAELDSLRITGHPTLERISGNHCQIRSLQFTGNKSFQWMGISQLKTRDVEIGELPKIAWLSLSLVGANELERVSLHAMPRLSTLQLVPKLPSGNIEDITYVANIGDELLAQVATLPKLESFVLTHAAITDAGLKHLATMPKLRSVSLSGPGITPKALQMLHEAISKN